MASLISTRLEQIDTSVAQLTTIITQFITNNQHPQPRTPPRGPRLDPRTPWKPQKPIQPTRPFQPRTPPPNNPTRHPPMKKRSNGKFQGRIRKWPPEGEPRPKPKGPRPMPEKPKPKPEPVPRPVPFGPRPMPDKKKMGKREEWVERMGREIDLDMLIEQVSGAVVV